MVSVVWNQAKPTHLSIVLCSIAACKKHTNSMTGVVWFKNKWLFWASQTESGAPVICFSQTFFHTLILSRQKKYREENENVIVDVVSRSVLTAVRKAVLPFFLSPPIWSWCFRTTLSSCESDPSVPFVKAFGWRSANEVLNGIFCSVVIVCFIFNR